jgi:hypothetical protein
MGLPIPKDKQDLYRVLILKDYFSSEDREKKKQNTIDRLETENKEIINRLKKIDRR